MSSPKTDRIGETRIASNNMKMTIVGYRDNTNIDVQFEDGTIVKHKPYYNFVHNKIKHPEYDKLEKATQKRKRMDKHIGETNTANNGMVITIIAYRRSDDIDIQFDDGTIVKHRTYYNFRHGSVQHPDYSKTTQYAHNQSQAIDRLGQIRTNKQGLKMTLIAYRNSTSCDIQFEDGTIVKDKCYDNFNKGSVMNPNVPRTKNIYRIGETNIATNGMKMTIIAYHRSDNIDIEFEDGVIVKHRQYINFKDGSIKHPFIAPEKQQPHTWHIGETYTMKSGRKITIIDWRNKKDIDIQFDDGLILKNRHYESIKRGSIAHPDDGKGGKNWKYNKTHYSIGTTRIATNGQKMTVIEYNNSTDMTVQFEDGTIIHNCKKHDFDRGFIRNPNYQKSQHIGQKRIARNGLKVKVLDYRSCRDVDYEFETGYIARNKDYKSFTTGCIRHPFPYVVNNINIAKPAYTYNNVSNFYCNCTKCGMQDILTIDEIKHHKCKGEQNYGIRHVRSENTQTI